MRLKYIDFYSKQPRRQIKYAIPAPIIEASITWARSSVQYTEDIRIDTGADISVLPIGLRDLLGLDNRDATFVMEISSMHGSALELVFLVDFVLSGPFMSPVQFRNVHVIFGDVDVALFGIWTALEHVPQLMCDFPGMRTSL